ncbi:MAG: hypothetical protein EBU59_05075 [Planctomycetia bacterium]|nr:hypothetical protein [Planctomycetia bacterium]
MAFVHLGELEKAKVFPNSLPPLPAAVDDAMPTGRAWTKPAADTRLLLSGSGLEPTTHNW